MKPSAVLPVAPEFRVEYCFAAQGPALALLIPGTPAFALSLDKPSIDQIRGVLDEAEAFLNKEGNA